MPKKSASLPPLIHTKHGVQDWFTHAFEKLGWMVLAKGKGMDHKIVDYKKELTHLLETITHLSTEYTCPDKLHDLKVMHMEVTYLLDYVKKHL